MKQFTKKLFLWLLFALIMQLVYANLLCEEQNSAQSAYLGPAILRVNISPPPVEETPAARLESVPSSSVFKEKDELFRPIIREVADRHEVDPALVKAIIMAESSYNPKAISKRGAKGLMQLMPLTAESLGVKDIFDPEHNINAGVGYFKKLLNQFGGDVKLALAAYNAGSKKVRQYKGIPPFESTQTYIKKVFEYYELYKKQI